jgi:hypothetical protein
VGRTCSSNGREENTCMLLVGKPQRKGPVGSPRGGWVDNMKVDMYRWDEVVLTGLVWHRIWISGGLL